ncbi:thiamine pyrophosphate-dependent enzyme [Paenarthrobacter sp. YAF11_1]|uniref:thiamine pyrophosphate-dependent enzyme n=1 Tax=Paenarthrobacter sp. YAF11_1 TaxID=3233074 RepID=UPI003F996C51
MLERTPTLATLLDGTEDRLVVTGLGSAANDLAYITDHDPRVFLLDGVMGAAASVGLGLALARPEQEILVVTGDGELLMNIGTLATIAVQNPQNLRIIVVDNGRYGLTGNQVTATHTVTDLEEVARGFGIQRTITVHDESDFAAARNLILMPGDTALVLIRVAPGPAANVVIEREGVRLRNNFRDYVLSTIPEHV